MGWRREQGGCPQSNLLGEAAPALSAQRPHPQPRLLHRCYAISGLASQLSPAGRAMQLPVKSYSTLFSQVGSDHICFRNPKDCGYNAS